MQPASSRREFLALVGALMLERQAHAEGAEVIHFEYFKPFNPERPLMIWDELSSWITPNDQIFFVAHYGYPEVNAAGWQLEIGGLVDKPRFISLDAIKSRPKKE